jgi:protease-4
LDAGHERQREPERETTAGPPPPWRGSGRGLLIGGAIAFGLLFLTIISITLVLVAGPGDGRGGEGRAEAPETFQEKYVSGRGADKIAVLPVVGQIGPKDSSSLGTTVATPETLRDQLRQAARDGKVKAIVLEINSPGGGVVASDQMHKSVQDFKETTEKPVVVSMGETTASGGYYISTAADKIVANENTLTGSLGVIFSYLNYKDAADKLGLEEEVIKSGKYKDIGSPFRKPTEKELEILQSLIDESYDNFVDVIVEGRNLPKDRVRELADGRVYSGLQAKSLGLVDELGDLEKAAEISEELASVEEATMVRYERAPGLLGLLQARLAPPEPETLKVLKAAGISLNPELQYLYHP